MPPNENAGVSTRAPDAAVLEAMSTVTAPDGARIRFSTHGGQSCSWTTADGVERLYLSPLIDRELDRSFFGVASPVEVRAEGSSIRVGQEAFADVVVWNPWRELARRLADLPDDGYRHFVCMY